jgi:hypothetical protein
VFTVSEDGARHVKFGIGVITIGLPAADTTLGAFIGGGFIQVPVNMNTFLGLF